MQASLTLDTHFVVADVDPRIFGGFIEHLGRAIYEGIYDPGSLLSDEHGFRKDVIRALQRLRMPVMRYPGGNFVSCYDWRDGVGPRDKRPARLDYAWTSIESNQFGTDEFMQWCKQLGTAPMMAVNLGTAGVAEAAALLEYCNLDTPTRWADERRKNGSAEPYNVKLWCLGNEMDGPWQAGHVPAREYGLRANNAARMMKGLDPRIETVACGSSGRGMATYLAYDRETLEIAWDNIDYISAHRYSSNEKNDSPAYLADGVEIDRVLDDYAGLLSYMRGVKKSAKQVHICFDEWNVWYRERAGSSEWITAPHLLEEPYNFEDALVVAQYLQAFIRRADVVKVACLAQIVNVIAPIMTRKKGLLFNTIFHPIEAIANHVRGQALHMHLDTPTYSAGSLGDAPALHAAATFDPTTGRVTVSVVHRDDTGPMSFAVRVVDRRIGVVSFSYQLAGADLKDANTWESPDAVIPTTAKTRVVEGVLHIELPPTSHVVVVVETFKR